MAIVDDVTQQMKDAMRAKDKVRLGALRGGCARAGVRDIRGHYTDRAVHEDSVIYKTGFVAPGSAGGFD